MLCRALALLTFTCAHGPARACETALLLALDVSNSVDVAEYRLQAEGIAAALASPELAEIILRDRVALAVTHWSGPDQQALVIPWVQPTSAADLRALAERIRRAPQAFALSDTAPGDALAHAIAQFSAAPACKRRIIDLSGDGQPNAGQPAPPQRRRAQTAGITVNALGIEGMGRAVSTYFERAVITADGFVMTARGYRDFARAIRAKMIRELSRVIG